MARVLLVANPQAGKVSSRVKEVIVKALSADFKLEVVDTAARNHGSELAADAVADGYDAVVAFGGDGTINEIAQALVGSEVALGLLPGGSTNVMARALGVPQDPVEATAYVASCMGSGTKRRVNVGRINDRYFLFSAGMGLDAEVVKRVEAEPDAKRRNHERVFVRKALAAGLRHYAGAKPAITMTVDGEDAVEVITALCCKAAPFTYLGRFPVDACPQARLEAGLDFLGFGRLHRTVVPRLVYSLFVSRSHVHWSNATYVHDAPGGNLTATRAFPLQVDGDYIGEYEKARLDLVPEALDILG